MEKGDGHYFLNAIMHVYSPIVKKKSKSRDPFSKFLKTVLKTVLFEKEPNERRLSVLNRIFQGSRRTADLR